LLSPSFFRAVSGISTVYNSRIVTPGKYTGVLLVLLGCDLKKPILAYLTV